MKLIDETILETNHKIVYFLFLLRLWQMYHKFVQIVEGKTGISFPQETHKY